MKKHAALEAWTRHLDAIFADEQVATGTVVPFRRCLVCEARRLLAARRRRAFAPEAR